MAKLLGTWVSSIVLDYRTQSKSIERLELDWVRLTTPEKTNVMSRFFTAVERPPPPPPPLKKNNGVILLSQLSVLRCSLTLISKKTEFFWKFKFTPLHLSLRLDFLPCLNYLCISVCSKTAGTVNFRLLALGLYKFVRSISRAYNRGAD